MGAEYPTRESYTCYVSNGEYAVRFLALENVFEVATLLKLNSVSFI